jgi:hypothetical protein
MKKMFDKEHIWTTLTSIIGFILAALVIFGVIGAEEKEVLRDAWDTIAAAIPGGDFTTIFGAVVAFVMLIVGLFTKDPKPPKSENK